MAAEWYEHISKSRVEPANEARLLRRLQPLDAETEATLTVARVTALIEAQHDLGASTRNKLRSVGKLAVRWAQANGRWKGLNPFELSQRARETQREYELLTLEELARVQRYLRPDRYRLFRCALHLGMRPGELLGLLRRDVDLGRSVINVRRSHGRDETKTGRTRKVPIHPGCRRDLESAMEEAIGEHVFGHRVTGELEKHTKLTRCLRTAMKRARVGVVAWVLTCRRRGCGYSRQQPTLEAARCPECDFRLWAEPEVRKVRWYDARHMCASLHHDAGADALCIALSLGHSVEGVTGSVYTHPRQERLALELSRWSLPR